MYSSTANSKENIISRLQEDILLMEGYKPHVDGSRHIKGLEEIEGAFRNNIFPTAAIHEFVCMKNEHTAGKPHLH
jgi:protein ImuA